jgi:hypothetical protein
MDRNQTVTSFLPSLRCYGRDFNAASSAPIGVRLAGFNTEGQPTARAGATLWAPRLSRKLNGEMKEQAPMGTRLSPLESRSSLLSSPSPARLSPQRNPPR